MLKFPRPVHLCLAHLVFLLSVGAAWADPLLTHPLSIKGHVLRAEIAHTEAQRRRGLMFREALGEDQGMLFLYPRAGIYSMWMKNTAVPLSVAFIDERGTILNIADMTPYSEQSHTAAGKALYALEMAQGWFRRHRVHRGDAVRGLDRLPRAE